MNRKPEADRYSNFIANSETRLRRRVSVCLGRGVVWCNMPVPYMTTCPKHPFQPYDNCGFCEAKAARQELELEDPDPDGWQIEQDRFERELESHWP